MPTLPRRIIAISSLLLLVVFASACSRQGESASTLKSSSNPQWIADGVLALVRAAPSAKIGDDVGHVFGFVPLASMHQGPWLSIDRSLGKLNLYDGDNLVSSSAGAGLESLKPGTYQILHKQKSPLWYASDVYYTKRGIQAPASGDRARYLRGALGEFALFIDKDLPLHSGPVWTSEVGGVRLDESDISRIYYTLAIGSLVEVK